MSSKRLVLLAVALLASASTWFYVNRIVRPEQVAQAAAHGSPRGNLSDLYPRWLGARELLRGGRNPYSAEITKEIQRGYYGRELDPARADDPKDQQGFAYPVYVVFLLAPTIGLPFEEVQTGFRWLLIAIAAGSVLLWLRVLRWRVGWMGAVSLMVLLAGWLPMVQGIKLQQLTLLVAGFLAACAALMNGGWLFSAGVVLALATIKPQLAWPIVAWLLVWAVFQWRARWRLLVGFGLVMALLLGGAEVILPGWLRMFFAAIGQYHQYTQNQSVLVFLFGSIAGRVLEFLCVVACAACVWRVRREAASSAAFGESLALVLALTALVVPMFAPYNQVLLVPVILVWLRGTSSSSESEAERRLPALRVLGFVTAAFLLWPWIATAGLTVAYPWLTPLWRGKIYLLPFYSNFHVPIFVYGLGLLNTWLNHSEGLLEPVTAE